MYIFFKRTVPYPMLMTFDAPDSTISCSRRERSNTPLQALTLLNDPVFFECAQTLAKQLCEQHGEDIAAAVDDLGRRPVSQERSYLTAAFHDVQRLEQKQRGKDGSSEQIKIAAMTAVARIVMNLDEFITRD